MTVIMAIALIVRTIDGDPLGQCSAACYDARPDSICRCICAGANHGVGRVRAMANAHDLAKNHANTTLHPETDQITIPHLDE